MWLDDANPWADYPWSRLAANSTGDSELPSEVDTVVIGAGFTGAAAAYHWAKLATDGRRLIVLEKDDPASGSSGRNEGLVVMGRYFAMVRDRMVERLRVVRDELGESERRALAEKFSDVYCRAAYRNADLIEQTVRDEGFDCDYARAGWVQARGASEQESLVESVESAAARGHGDWTSISPAEVLERSGMRVEHNAGFSLAAASWHPAKWVWSLIDAALQNNCVSLFTRTPVAQIESFAGGYRVTTPRGVVECRHVLLATESYSPQLEPRLHDAILPMQEQAASGLGGPPTMAPHVGISGAWFFAGRYGERVLFGSGGSRVRDKEAGRNWPSRFLSWFVAGEMQSAFGQYELQMTNEWSGTVGYTPDEYPIVGSLDDAGKYIIAGMCGSGSGVSFNAARCLVERILNHVADRDADDDYPSDYFSPTRLLDPANHTWP
jgi:glycine/D-amino acid oxidase-like deaminating enzyme